MRKIFRARKARLVPVIITAIVALASLKAAGLWVDFTAASAEGAHPVRPAAAGAVSRAPSETEDRLLEQPSARIQELDLREADLDTRESVIAAAEMRLESTFQALHQEKEALALAEGDRARDRRDEIGELSNAYERMKPRDAARIFEVLDDDILLPVAAGMRTQALAGVLAEMSAERAKALTIALANREAPLQPLAATAQPALTPIPAAAREQ